MKTLQALAFLWLCCQSPAAISDVAGASLSQLRSDLYRLKGEFAIPAMATIMVDADNTLLVDINGLADLESKRLANTETLFRIGSITKMFTSLALLMLQEDGRLDLDSPVNQVAPDLPLKNQWHGTHPVKVAHLLEHTAGLTDLSSEEFEHNTPIPLQQALRLKNDLRHTRWPPGLHHSYSNVGYGLAEYIVEKASGQAYASVLARRIFEPLGMSSAGIDYDDQTRLFLATGYDTDGLTKIPYWHMLFRGFGAINLRPVDMVAFLQFLLNQGMHSDHQLLSKAAIDRMETPSTSLAAASGLRYGYSLGNYTSLHNGLLLHGHGGDADGYLSRLAYSRDTGLAYFVVINAFKNDAMQAIRERLDDFISVGRKVSPPPPYPLDEFTLASYTGRYEAVTYRFSNSAHPLNVSLKDGNLLLSYGKRKKALLPVNKQHFRYRSDSLASLAFVRRPGGELYLQGDLGNFLRLAKSPSQTR